MSRSYAAILCVQLVTLYVLFPRVGNIMAALAVTKVAIVSRHVVPDAIVNC